MRTFIFLISFSFLVTNMQLPAAPLSSPNEDEKNENIIVYHIYNCHFQKARTAVDGLMNKEPGSIKWKFYRAMIDWRQLWLTLKTDYRLDTRLSSKVETELIDIKTQCEKAIEQQGKSRDMLFYAGAVNGYLGMYYAGMKNEPMKAIKLGKAGMDYYESLLSSNPNDYDAYFSRGVYHFYASGVSWYVKPFLYIFGMSGSESKAVECFQLVQSHGRLAKVEATEYLAELYIRNKQYDAARSQYAKIISQFPDGRYVAYLLIANMYRQANQKGEMENVYREAINESYKIALTPDNGYHLGDVYLRLASSYEESGLIREALTVYEDGITHKVGYNEWMKYRAGLLWEKLGNANNALQLYQGIPGTELSPEGYAEVKKRISALRK